MAEMTGAVLSVDAMPAGSLVAEEYVADSFVLAVYDIFDFTPDGGTVKIDGVTYAYTAADWEASTLALDPLSGFTGADVDTPVMVEPYAETKLALVDLGVPGDDALKVTVPHALSAMLEVGQRDPDGGEVVSIAESAPGLWTVVDVLDRPAQVISDAVDVDPTDGLAPTDSPDADVTGGYNVLHVRWAGIENADPVTYQVHLSTVADFVPDETTLAALTGATAITLKALPDGSPLAQGTTYYVVLVAQDADGAAPAGTQDSDQLHQITGPDISAAYVYTGNLIADQITGGYLSADVGLVGTLKTAESGARVELGPFGLVAYNSAGEPASLIGADGNSTFKGDVQARTLTVTDGMSIRGGVNEVAVAATLNLAAGVSASPTPPVVVPSYTTAPTFLDGSGVSYASQGYVFRSIQRIGTQWGVAMSSAGGGVWTYRMFNADGTLASSYPSLGGSRYSGVAGFAGAPGSAYAMGGDGRIYRTSDPAQTFLVWDMIAAPAGTSGSGDVTYSGGQARFRATPGVTAGLWTPDENAFNFRGKAATIEVDFPAVSSSSQSFRFRLDADEEYPRYYAEVAIQTEANGTRRLYLKAGDTVGIGLPTVEQYVTYDRTSMRWLRLTESNGALRLETSPTGSIWTTRITHNTTPVPHEVWASVGVFMIANGAGGNLDVYVGDLTVRWGASDFGPTFTRTDLDNPPAIGKDSTYILVAEHRASDKAIIIKSLDPKSPGVVIQEWSTGATALDFLTPLVSVHYGQFDLGVSRFLISTAGAANQYALAFTLSGSSLTYDANRSFRIPGLAGTAYDGTRFWTLNSDGVLSGHSTITWTDTTAFTKTWYAATTWYDGDATGGTHETSPSPRTAFSLRKRQYYTVTSADIPDEGGTDDPDRIRIYLASSAATTRYLQATTAEGVNSAQLGTATFSGTTPPAPPGNFPATIGAKIKNDSGTLLINGEGQIKAAEFTSMLGGSAATLSKPYLTLMDIYEAMTTGGGVLTSDSTGVAWSQRFLTMGGGRHAAYTPGGYFQIEMPPDGTVIPCYNTAEATQTVASGRIPTGSWRTLFYELPFGGSQTSDPSRFRLVGYDTAPDFVVPWSWLPIVTRNAGTSSDSAAATFGTHRWIDGRRTTVVAKERTVTALGALYETTTTAVTDTGLTRTVLVSGPEAVFSVDVVLDIQTINATNRTLVGRLVVDGVTQSAQIILRIDALGSRLTASQTYVVTGLAAGNRIFKVQVSLTGGTTPADVAASPPYRVNAQHSNIRIIQNV